MHVENRIYRKPDLVQRYGVSKVTIWRYIKDGLIPKPGYLRKGCIWTPEQIAQADRNILETASPES